MIYNRLLVLLSIVSFQLGSNFLFAEEIKVESEISAAKVYLNAAQLSRKINTELPKGTQIVVVENISTYLDAETIQVSGEGDFVIVGVSTRRNFMVDRKTPKEIAVLEDSLNLVNTKIEYNNSLLSVYDSERKMILANDKINWEKLGFAIEDLEELSNFYRKRLTDLMTRKIEVSQFTSSLVEVKNKLQAQLNELRNQQRKPSIEILIEVAAKTKTKANLELKYVVSNAGWYPTYELSASSSSSNINLKTKAKVYQNTGIDWKNVKLNLSTANPIRNNNKPNLTPWRLDFIAPMQATVQGKSNRLYYMAEESAAMNDAAAMPAAGSAADFTNVSENLLSFNYDIELQYSVKGNGKAQNVHIKTDDLKAEFYHYIAPKVREEAFLLAAVKDWESLNIMPGEVLLYLDNNYVGKSTINPSITSEKLNFSLGVDPSVTVDRCLIKDYATTRTIGSNTEKQIGIEIKVKNTRSSEVKFLIEDQIPISSNKDISIKVDELSGAELTENTGKLKWKGTLFPAEAKTFQVKYSVKYPKDKNINL